MSPLNIATQRGVGVLTFVTREVFVLFDGFTLPPQPLSSRSMQVLEVFQDARSFAPHSGYVRGATGKRMCLI